MLIFEFGTFLRARFTDCRTYIADLFGVRTVSRHISGSHGANLGTIPEYLNAMDPGLYVRFIQARCQAFFAHLHALVTHIDAGLVLLNIRTHNGGHLSSTSFPFTR